MNDIELRAECIRQASANLRELAADTDLVIKEAQKLRNFIMGMVSLPPTPLKQAA